MIDREDQSSASLTPYRVSHADDADNENCRWSSGRDGHEVPEGRGLRSAYSDSFNAETCQSRASL